ncbi:MAG: preQ(1) synthase [Myxococcaceae bacterium]|nr:preQ(1) synthase [Myxococcaceae bacterium]
MPSQPSKKLETFKNPAPTRDYQIAFDCPEFTCLCPLTGQPDFAKFRIRYVPNKLCVELKSLKMYLWSYRNEGAFHEAVTNQILDDLVKATKPRSMTVVGDWLVRGGITTEVTVNYP